MNKTLIFLALIITLIGYSSPSLAKFKQPDPPPSVPSTNSGTGTRPYCPLPASGVTLTPLIPNSNWGYTTSENPTVWAHIFYENNSENSLWGEVSLLDKNDKLVTDRTEIILPNFSGAFAMNLPPLPEGNHRYQWLLEVNCGDDVYIDIGGYIYQTQTPDLTNLNAPERINFYEEQGIWYDALNESANFYCQNVNYWGDLLTQENLHLIVVEPLNCQAN
jgi:hypothetical protein